MSEWAKKQYNAYYNAYVPWLEDKYLAWFGENKTSYTAKGTKEYLSCLSLSLSSHLINPPFASWGQPAIKLIVRLIEKLKTNITGDENINAIQGGVAEGVGGQLGSKGLLGGVGDASSKEGINRAERGDTGPLGKVGEGLQGLVGGNKK
jgi:hypothetical protein